MARIWEDENRFGKWLAVEIAAGEAMAEEGLIPSEALENIKKKAAFSVERILRIEEETKHDVIAFLTNVAEHVGPDSRFIHLGLTSSDILDTSFAMLLKEAMLMIIEDVKQFMAVIKERAMEHKHTVMIGRSHGIHAEPITFGLKVAVWYSEMKRNLQRLNEALETKRFTKSGGLCLQETWIEAGRDIDTNPSKGSPRPVFRRPGHSCRDHGKDRRGNPPPAKNRGA
jgi:adenylosuccinate lyase